MERKLLSLPSFFVLLLIAGIAFLAAPVVDVQAAAPSLDSITRVTMTPTGVDATNALTAGGRKNLVIIKFAVADPVLITGDADKKFDSVDVKVVITNSSPNANLAASQELASAAFTVTPLPVKAAAASDPLSGATVANTWFVVNAPVPANGMGTITVQVRGSTATPPGEFESDDTAWAMTADQPATAGTNVVHYNTYDGDGPEPTLTGGLGTTTANNVISVNGGTSDADIFQIEIAFDEALGTADGAEFDIDDDLELKTSPEMTEDGSKAMTPWLKAGTGTTDTPAPTYVVPIDPRDGATSVEIKLVKDAVTDANGNKSDEEKVTVTINQRPVVTIDKSAVTEPVPTTVGTESIPLAVTFKLSAVPGTGDDDLDASEITVVNGTLGNFKRDLTMQPTDDVKASYTATITLPEERKSPVTITVDEDAVMSGGLGNPAATASIDVTVPTAPPTDPTAPVIDPAKGDSLPTGRRGFSFTLPAMPAPTAANGSDRFIVLAKASNNSTDNGLSVPAAQFVDINDGVWQDLADFLAYDGGTIELIGPAGTTKGDLVISEMMWGRDEGLGNSTDDTSKSQWIELYNATTTKGTATGAIASGKWEIEFHAGTGARQANALQSDSFSNRELGNAHWEIPNVAGGKYGQGGRTKITAGVAGSLRDLVSMRRKIDYAKVEKTDHKATEAENRPEQLKGIPDGALAGSWEASTSRVNMSGTRKGTPGARHVVVVGTSGISKSVVFNEIANRSDKKFDWIELYNPGSSEVKINNWVLSKVTGVDKDDKLFKFESDDNIVVPAKGFLLVVNEDPSETALAAGKNVDNPNSNANSLPTEVYIASGLDIPEKDYLLILRTEEKLKSHEKIVDIAGNLGALNLVHSGNATELWPLKAWKRIKADDLGQNNDKTWVRDKGKDLYHGDAWKSDGGFTGLGIDRNPDSSDGPTSGTPGFDNGAVKDKVKDLTASDPVVISEIMYGSGNGRVPQWIELYNPSATQAVKLHNWRLEVQNTIDADEKLNVEFNYTLTLPDVRIQPKQTVLIVSSSTGDSTRDRFPKDRLINIWSTRDLRDITEMSGPRDAILSSVGFYMKLSDPDKAVVDEVGNIDSNRRTADSPDWELPGGNLDDGGRASMMRREKTFGDGTEEDAWISAAIVDGARKIGINELYYGDEDDLGTPGYRTGGPVPVQLSSFYSKRNAAGAVVITWSTESELDNAGFNILRSQSRTGEFVRINAQLIPGAGTTGEKTAYTWTDTGASPNVLYFYQIEDVSLAGDHRTLRTTRLRGYIGAAGKATTTWGDLKSRE